MSSSKLQQKLDKEVEFHRFADNYIIEVQECFKNCAKEIIKLHPDTRKIFENYMSVIDQYHPQTTDKHEDSQSKIIDFDSFDTPAEKQDFEEIFSMDYKDPNQPSPTDPFAEFTSMNNSSTTSSQSYWDCEHCTFRNDIDNKVCQICGQPCPKLWTCTICQNMNPTTTSICQYCNIKHELEEPAPETELFSSQLPSAQPPVVVEQQEPQPSSMGEPEKKKKVKSHLKKHRSSQSSTNSSVAEEVEALAHHQSRSNSVHEAKNSKKELSAAKTTPSEQPQKKRPQRTFSTIILADNQEDLSWTCKNCEAQNNENTTTCILCGTDGKWKCKYCNYDNNHPIYTNCLSCQHPRN